MLNPFCPNCRSKEYVRLHDDRKGTKRYKCNHCFIRFSKKGTPISDFKTVYALQLKLAGLTYSIIAETLETDESTIQRWLRPYRNIIKELKIPKMEIHPIKMDDYNIIRVSSLDQVGIIFKSSYENPKKIIEAKPDKGDKPPLGNKYLHIISFNKKIYQNLKNDLIEY